MKIVAADIMYACRNTSRITLEIFGSKKYCNDYQTEEILHQHNIKAIPRICSIRTVTVGAKFISILVDSLNDDGSLAEPIKVLYPVVDVAKLVIMYEKE